MSKEIAEQAIDVQSRTYKYRRSPDQDAAELQRYPVVVIGAGPVGIATAIDLAQSGVNVVLLDEDNTLSSGSRAICFSKRTLEIFDRLGCGQPVVDKGVVWQTGKVFFRDKVLYDFNLLPDTGYRRPAFVNIQQYYVEAFLLDRATELLNLDIRWKSLLVGIEQDSEGALLTVETPDGRYQLRAEWVVACDGGRSTTRQLMGLESKGHTFKDRFLIADIKMGASFPPERWFWFDPPFHPGQSVLLHKQPDDVWRIDFQLGWDADPVAERQPEKVIPRVKALLGDDAEFTLEWVSVYTFVCMRMDKFRHGRVIFAGDSAHGVSPFGARGANSGVQDAENIAWKLRYVLDGKAPESLLDTYDSERSYAADENILNSTRSTDFITPKNQASMDFRNATLDLARDFPFAQKLVNSGRLSVPATLLDSPLNTPDADKFEGNLVPGSVAADAPIEEGGAAGWLLDKVGNEFTLLVFADSPAARLPTSAELAWLAKECGPVSLVVVTNQAGVKIQPDVNGRVITDVAGSAVKRYDGRSGTTYLLRPDQHVCARFRSFNPHDVHAALRRATGNS
ncbi:FAD-dependent oxidoreductase [Ferrovibrio sp.]|uniref:FAD-dependent oxidoreductase n=1 Tax=Ferrovibrio sp. TaxID=1917215 RepID=UPI00311F7019